MIFVAIFAIAACDDTPKSDKPVVKIGLIAPVSGEHAEVGTNIRNIIMNYVRDTADDNAIEYKLIVEDDGSNMKNDAPLAQKLINVDNADALITAYAYVGMVVAPIARDAKIPNINIGVNEAAADGIYNFINLTPPSETSREMIKNLRARNIKNVALIVMDHAGPLPQARELKKLLNAEKIKYTEHGFGPHERDFKTLVQKVKTENPDIIVLLAMPPSLDILGKQIAEADLKIPLTSQTFFSTSNNKELFNGMFYTDIPDGNDKFVAETKRKMGIENLFLLAFAQDIIKMYIDTIEDFYAENGRVPTRDEIAAGIRNLTDFHGAAGTYSMGENGVIKSRAVTKEIRNGVPVTVKD
jgi:branched-chain amino acid transport system substrate-binding protein